MKAIAKMNAGIPNVQWNGKIRALISDKDPKYSKVFPKWEKGAMCIVEGVEYEIDCKESELPEWFKAKNKQVRSSKTTED